MDRWRGKIAVVTGAGSGIGAVVTHSLLRQGIHVFGFDIETSGFEIIEEKRARLSNAGLFFGIQCDLSNNDEICQAFETVKREYGGVDILVNNAGVIDYGRIIDSERTSFQRLMNINFLAVVTCTTIAVKSMREREMEGHIFNINSVLGHEIPMKGLSEEDNLNGFNIYPSLKHATVALTHSVRRELAANNLPIRITSISPGLVRTNLAKSASLANLYDETPALEPEDIADGLIYALGTRPQMQITEMTIRRTGEP